MFPHRLLDARTRKVGSGTQVTGNSTNQELVAAVTRDPQADLTES